MESEVTFVVRMDGSQSEKRSLWLHVSCVMILGSRLCITFVILIPRQAQVLTVIQRQAITPSLLWASLTDFDM
jgi:hypothetical protein